MLYITNVTSMKTTKPHKLIACTSSATFLDKKIGIVKRSQDHSAIVENNQTLQTRNMYQLCNIRRTSPLLHILIAGFPSMDSINATI